MSAAPVLGVDRSDSGRRRRDRPAVVAVTGKALELLSLALLVTVVPRVLGPTDYGFLAVAMSIVTIGSATLALGGPVLMARFVPTVPESDRPALARALAVRTAYWRGGLLLAAAVVAVAVAVVVPAVSFAVVLVLLAALVCDVGATILLQIGLSLRRVTAWSFRYPIQNLALVLVVVVLGPAAGRSGVLAAVLVSAVAGLGAGLVTVRRTRASATWDLPLPEGITRFALLQGLGSGALMLTHRAGILAIALLVGSTVQTGFAGLAIGVSLALVFAGVQPFVAELPRLAERWETHRPDAEHDVRRLGWLALWGLTGAALLGAVLAGPLLQVAVGQDYEGATGALQVALAAVPFAAALGMLTVATALQMRPALRLAALSLGLVATLALAAALVPTYEASGAAIAYSAGAAVTGVATCALLPTVVRPLFLLASAVCAAAVAAVALAS